MLEEIAPLKDRWLELYPYFSDFREALLATVTRWEWSNGPRYDPRPFYFQRQSSRGRLLRVVPVNDKDTGYTGYWKTGYDADGKPVVSRDGHGFESLYSFSKNYVEVYKYQTYYDVFRGVSRLYLDNTQPSHFISFSIIGWPEDFHDSGDEVLKEALHGRFQIYTEREQYSYLGSNISKILLGNWNNGSNNEGNRTERKWSTTLDIKYHHKNNLQYITAGSHEVGDFRIVYRKRQSGETLASLAEITRSKLVEIIPKIIVAAKFSEPLYCLQLRFSDTHYFPPTLIPGFESRRHRLLKELDKPYGPNEIWAQVWEAEESADDPFPPWQIDDEETLEACERLQIEVGIRGNKARHDFGLRTLRQVAKTLNRIDWSQYASITDDFIVYAYDQESLGMALHLSGASPDQISNWRKRGLL